MENYKKIYRPQFHFTPQKNWMNDPCGLIYYKRHYHLYYQYNPYATVWGPMHWGHAVSNNLVDWIHLPIALKPDEQGVCYTGSCVEDVNNSSELFDTGSGIVAIYTSVVDCSSTHSPLQQQSVAYSIDQGRDFTKYKNNPVIPNPGIEDFRDSKVLWFKATKQWIMVVSGGDFIRFYSSSNLKQWTYLSDFGIDQGAHGLWETPDLFELPVNQDMKNKKWVLMVGEKGTNYRGDRERYFIGTFDGTKFTSIYPDKIFWCDYGKDFYASQSWYGSPKEDEEKIIIAWMNNWEYAEQTPTQGWRGAMTIPRKVKLKDNGQGITLIQEPIPELNSLIKKYWIWENITITPEMNLLSDIYGDVLEIIAEFELGTSLHFGFKVRKFRDEQTDIGYNTIENKIYVDRKKSGKTNFSEGFPGRYEAPLYPINNKIKMHIFIDRCSVEVFANNGEIVLTNLIFPSLLSNGLELYSNNGWIKLNRLEIYALF